LTEAIQRSTEAFKETEAQLNNSRTLSPEAMARIKARLDSTAHVPIEITSVMGADTYDLANQIKSLFENSGFEVNGINQGIFSGPVHGVKIHIKRIPEPQLQLALAQLLKELNQPLTLYTENKTNMSGSSEISIVVGSNK
jgi:hypothetical protein